MMASSWVKYSGGKIVPHSDLRAGTTREGTSVNCDKVMRIGTWNVRSLRTCGKLENLKVEMERLNIDVLGISEMKWPEEGDFWSGSYRIIHTGSLNGNAGVGIMLIKSAGMRVKSFLQYNERIVMVKIET